MSLSVDSNGMCTLFKCPSTLNLSEGLDLKKAFIEHTLKLNSNLSIFIEKLNLALGQLVGWVKILVHN